MHGKTSPIVHDGRGVFAGIANPCEVGRYHSLIAEGESLPPELQVTARTAEGEIMGLRHATLNIEGVQFHPESVLTPQGPAMMANFLAASGGRAAPGPGASGG
jgi:para-aminobenzoate synthetase component 2